jgi:hypothetical protein
MYEGTFVEDKYTDGYTYEGEWKDRSLFSEEEINAAGDGGVYI